MSKEQRRLRSHTADHNSRLVVDPEHPSGFATYESWEWAQKCAHFLESGGVYQLKDGHLIKVEIIAVTVEPA